MSDVKTDKVLCHAGGGLFCDYLKPAVKHAYTHRVYITNADVPPDPATLGIKGYDSSSLEWREVKTFTRPLVQAWEQEQGTFDFDVAEWVSR